MKIQLRLAAALSALLMISNAFPVYAGSADRPPEATAYSQSTASLSDSTPPEEWKTVSSGNSFPSCIPGEAPAFSARIEYLHGQGYVVRGTFTEFLPDTSLVMVLYSLDGETWQSSPVDWLLHWLHGETTEDLNHLQTQTCLYGAHEPLAGYLAGQLNRFYLKLQITLENGTTYDTQAVVFEHSAPQPLPEEFTPVASFVPAMRIRRWVPFESYGQYQITVSTDATQEDISALLPDTLPISVNLMEGNYFAANAVADCPVTWKPLSLSRLTAGESVTIEDAAEEIIIPAGTLLNTPYGIFCLKEPLGIDFDEIRLVLNVVAENAEPTGMLACEINGLQIAFDLKPTGATAIRAYTFSEDGTEWVEIPEPLLPEEVNAPSSSANSTYTFVLKNTSEPYRSYLAAENAKEESAPFYVGLQIEGGVYDGKQLILAWPDTYELPARLPNLSGSGGNECNAGSDNKNDSTLEGQRPGLPQDPEERPNTQEPNPTQDTKELQNSQNPDTVQDTKEQQNSQNPDTIQDAKEQPNSQNPETTQNTKEEQNLQESEPAQDTKDEQNAQTPKLTLTPEYKPELQQPAQYLPADKPESRADISPAAGEQQPELPQTLGEADTSLQIAIAETVPALSVGAKDPAAIPVFSAETGSPAWRKSDYGAEYSLHSLLLPAAAAIAIGITIAAGKVIAGSKSGRIYEKIIRTFHRLLHLK